MYVRLHPFIIGSCGMTRFENEHILTSFRVKSPDVRLGPAQASSLPYKVRKGPIRFFKSADSLFLKDSRRVRGGSRIHAQGRHPTTGAAAAMFKQLVLGP